MSNASDGDDTIPLSGTVGVEVCGQGGNDVVTGGTVPHADLGAGDDLTSASSAGPATTTCASPAAAHGA